MYASIYARVNHKIIFKLSSSPYKQLPTKKKLQHKYELDTNLSHENREGSTCSPIASVTMAKRYPKKAPNEGIAAPPLAYVASYCKCSCFNMELAFLELALVCFLLIRLDYET